MKFGSRSVDVLGLGREVIRESQPLLSGRETKQLLDLGWHWVDDDSGKSNHRSVQAFERRLRNGLLLPCSDRSQDEFQFSFQ